MDAFLQRHSPTEPLHPSAPVPVDIDDDCEVDDSTVSKPPAFSSASASPASSASPSFTSSGMISGVAPVTTDDREQVTVSTNDELMATSSAALMSSSTSDLPHDDVHVISWLPDGASANPAAAAAVPVAAPTRCSTLGLYQAAGVPAAAAVLAPSPSPSSISTPSMKASNAVSIITTELPRAPSTRSSTTDTDHGQAVSVFLIMKGIPSASAVKIDNDFAAVERYFYTFGTAACAFQSPPEPPWVFERVFMAWAAFASPFLSWPLLDTSSSSRAPHVDSSYALVFDPGITRYILFQCVVQVWMRYRRSALNLCHSNQHAAWCVMRVCRKQWLEIFENSVQFDRRTLAVELPRLQLRRILLFAEFLVADIVSLLDGAFYLVLHCWMKDQIILPGLCSCQDKCKLYMASALVIVISNIRFEQCYRQPKSPWQLCTAQFFSWFGTMELINGFLLEASPWCRDSMLFLQRKISGPYLVWLYSSGARTIARCYGVAAVARVEPAEQDRGCRERDRRPAASDLWRQQGGD